MDVTRWYHSLDDATAKGIRQLIESAEDNRVDKDPWLSLVKSYHLFLDRGFSNWNELPEELQEHIFTNLLTIKERIQLCATSKKFRRFCERMAHKVDVFRENRHQLRAHRTHVSALAWCPTGTRFATASWDGTAAVWDARTGELLLRLEGHRLEADASVDENNYVMTIDWERDADGSRIATGGTAPGSSRCIVWNANTGEVLHRLTGHTGTVSLVRWSFNAPHLLTMSEDNTVAVWDADTGRRDLVLRGHRRRVTCAEWAPAADRILTASHDATAMVWDATFGTVLQTFQMERALWFAKWSPDGARALFGDESGKVSVWNAVTGQRDLEMFPENALAPCWAVGGSWSPDGTLVAAAFFPSDFSVHPYNAGAVMVWNASTGRVVFRMRAKTDDVTFSPEGANLLMVTRSNGAMMVDLSGAGSAAHSDAKPVDLGFDATDGQWSPDGTRIVLGNQYGMVKVWHK